MSQVRIQCGHKRPPETTIVNALLVLSVQKLVSVSWTDKQWSLAESKMLFSDRKMATRPRRSRRRKSEVPLLGEDNTITPL